MNLPILSQIPSPYATVLLLGLLIVAFVIAFKVMQMVFETLLVTAFSGGFYLALVYLFGFTFSINDLLFYAFLGSSLYMGYSLLASAYGIASTAIGVPYKMLKIAVIPFKKMYGKIKEEHKLRKLRKSKSTESTGGKRESNSNSSGDNNTKEVVLDKVRKEDEDDGE